MLSIFATGPLNSAHGSAGYGWAFDDAFGVCTNSSDIGSGVYCVSGVCGSGLMGEIVS